MAGIKLEDNVNISASKECIGCDRTNSEIMLSFDNGIGKSQILKLVNNKPVKDHQFMDIFITREQANEIINRLNEIL